MKKFFIFGLLLILICFGVTAYADDIGIKLKQEKADNAYLVTIDFDENTNIAVMSFEIKYDNDSFILSDIKGENIPDGAMLQANETFEKNKAKISFMSLEPLTEKFSFTFLLTPKNENCETEITLENIRLADINEAELTAESNSISVIHNLGNIENETKEETTISHSGGGTRSNKKSEENQALVLNPIPESKAEDNKIFFTDLSDFSWAEVQINYLAEKGIIKGTGENTFSPSANIKRGDFICLLMRMLGLSSKGEENFADVNKNEYWYNEILAAKENGIAFGSDGKFNPGDNITREDMFTLTARAMKYFGGETANYLDYDEISDYARDSINAMSELGYIRGNNGKINPKNSATRAETAVMLYNIYTGGSENE